MTRKLQSHPFEAYVFDKCAKKNQTNGSTNISPKLNNIFTNDIKAT
jgi:hypothetical protein